jgi:hypothetical protein
VGEVVDFMPVDDPEVATSGICRFDWYGWCAKR